MNCYLDSNSRKYLQRFDKILRTMACKMLSKCPTNSITLDFIDCMIPHHQAAIYMCENLLKYTSYHPLEDIARSIIATQENGIRKMREIASTTRYLNNTCEDVNIYFRRYRSITENMVCRMRSASRCNNIDLNFTNEMIPHHEGAIEMCNNLLKYQIDPRLEAVARNIIAEQSRGVRELKQIRDNLCD